MHSQTTSVDQLRDTLRRIRHLKGRQADEASLHDVRALIGDAPHRRDLLIEHLHQLNDCYRGLHERHLVALAQEIRDLEQQMQAATHTAPALAGPTRIVRVVSSMRTRLPPPSQPTI